MSQHPSLDDSAFEPLQNLHQAVESLSFPSYPLCIVTRLQRHGSDDSSKGKDREGEIEWVVAAGLVLEGGKREQWWSRVFTRDELERSAEASRRVGSRARWELMRAERVDSELGGVWEGTVCAP